MMSTSKKLAAAESKSTPPEVFLKLAKDKDIIVRYRVAISDITPVEALMILIHDEEQFIRADALYFLANHPDVPVEILKELATYESSAVRYGVRCHPKTTEEIYLIARAYDLIYGYLFNGSIL